MSEENYNSEVLSSVNENQIVDKEYVENLKMSEYNNTNVLEYMVENPEYFISPDEFYNAIKPMDGAIKIKKKYSIFKFQIESREQLIYEIIQDDDIDRWKYAIKLNSILHFEGFFARPRDPKYSTYGFGYGLTVRSNIIINCLKQCKLVTEKSEVIELFTDLEKVIYTKNVIKLKGVVKSNFQSNTSNVQYIIGSITDLKLKLKVKIFNCYDLKLCTEDMVILKGVIVEDKGQLYFKVSSFYDVEKLTDEKVKDVKMLSKIVKTPKRKMEILNATLEKKVNEN